jgi:hypothetical protein
MVQFERLNSVINRTSLKSLNRGNILKKVCFSLLCLFIISCDKDNKQQDDAIVGKWGLIAIGYYESNNVVINPVENSQSYVEYLSKGKVKRPYLYMGEITEIEFPYRIDKEFLYENYNDKVNMFTYKYKVEGNKLTLDYVQGDLVAIDPQMRIWIYQRLEK